MLLRNGRNRKIALASLVALASPGIWVWAQEGSPFGTPMRTEEPARPAVRPAPALRPAEPEEKHPVVLTVRESNPSDPAAWAKATRMMVDIRRFDEAVKYLEPLNAAGIDDRTAFELHRQLGTGTLLEWGRIAELQPGGAEAARQILAGAGRFARDPNRVEGLIVQLDDLSIRRRTEALEELRALDLDGIAAILRTGATASNDQRIVLVDTLQAWGKSVEGPLMAALLSTDPAIRSLAIETLGRRQCDESLVWLLDPLRNPATDSTERALAEAACRRILESSAPNQADTVQRLHRAWQARAQRLGDSSPAEMWRWDDAAGKFERVATTMHEVAVAERGRLALSLEAIDPERAEFRLMAWRGRLAAVQRKVGLGRAVYLNDLEGVAPPSVAELNELLASELPEARPGGAVAAADLLGVLGDPSILDQGDAASPLAEALRHSDRSVRLAAARAILRLAPTRSFPGSNRLVPALCYFLKSQGSPRVLVGHPGVRESHELLGSLAEIGYRADAAHDGRELFRMATAHPDYEMILLSGSIDGPESYELLQQLRRDPRTAEIPIGLAVRLEHLDRARRIARDEPRTYAFPWPHSTEFVRLGLDEVAAVSGGRVPSLDERVRQSREAMGLLAEAMMRPDVYVFEDLYAQEEMLVELLTSPTLGADAARALGVLATPASQRALVATIGDPVYPLALRNECVGALENAIDRRGLLLTTREIRRAYDLRNDLGQESAEELALLDRLLDALEFPSGASSRPGS